MRTIPLTRGRVALVDDEDYKRVSQYKWHVSANRYAATGGSKTSRMYLHRFIANTPPDMVTDHINGNPFDNRRANIRICTNSQNLMNRGKSSNNTAGFKGVTRLRRNLRKPFMAQIGVGLQHRFLGYYATAEEAHAAYVAAATEQHGEFLRT